MENKILPIIIIGGIVIAILLILVYVNVTEKPAPKFNTSSNVNITYFSIMLESNADTKISYILSNSTQMLMRGTITKGIIEQYKNIPENQTVNLTGYSENYYYNTTICNITENNQVCSILLKKKALNFTAVLTNESLFIKTDNQTIQNPTICFAWRTNVVNLNMNLFQIDKPFGYSQLVDKCFLSDDINQDTNFTLDIIRNPHYNLTELLKVKIIDSEEKGYKNIGEKEFGVLLS